MYFGYFFIKPKTLLYNCTTSIEHYTYIDTIIKQIQNLHGIHGLKNAGFNYITTTDHNMDSSNSSSSSIYTKLIHESSHTIITKSNRKIFIADGEMYEQIVRLCQEYVQELMIKEGNLYWITVCNGHNVGNGTGNDDNNSSSDLECNPIRVLVDQSFNNNNKDNLLVVKEEEEVEGEGDEYQNNTDTATTSSTTITPTDSINSDHDDDDN